MKILSILGARPQIIKHAVIEEGIKKLYGKKNQKCYSSHRTAL